MSVFGTPATIGNSGYPLASVSSGNFVTSLGDLIVVFMANLFGISGACTCADTAGNTYTPVPGSTGIDPGGNPAGNWFYCLSATNASATNNVTVSTSSSGMILVMYVWDVPITGLATFDFVAPSSPGSYVGQATPGSVSFTPTGTDELILATAADPSRTTTGYTAGGGYTLESAITGAYSGYLAGEHIISATPPSTASFTYTGPGGTQNFIAAIGFKSGTRPTQPVVNFN